jgi:hypothetical protein
VRGKWWQANIWLNLWLAGKQNISMHHESWNYQGLWVTKTSGGPSGQEVTTHTQY